LASVRPSPARRRPRSGRNPESRTVAVGKRPSSHAHLIMAPRPSPARHLFGARPHGVTFTMKGGLTALTRFGRTKPIRKAQRFQRGLRQAALRSRRSPSPRCRAGRRCG
jgi:hypothetical protein